MSEGEGSSRFCVTPVLAGFEGVSDRRREGVGSSRPRSGDGFPGVAGPVEGAAFRSLSPRRGEGDVQDAGVGLGTLLRPSGAAKEYVTSALSTGCAAPHPWLHPCAPPGRRIAARTPPRPFGPKERARSGRVEADGQQRLRAVTVTVRVTSSSSAQSGSSARISGVSSSRPSSVRRHSMMSKRFSNSARYSPRRIRLM
jgi:hypothetical protein